MDNTNTVTTIKHLADEARARALSHYGEAAFARMCMEFQSRLVPEGACDEEGELGDDLDEDVSFVIAVIKLMAHSTDPKTLQLGMIWLDGKGFGQVTIPQLYKWFEKYRPTSQA